MNIQTSITQPILSLTVETCLATITQDVDAPVQSLYADLEAQNIAPRQPMIFIYRDLDGDIHRKFSLEVAQPVSAADLATYTGTLQSSELAAMQFVEREHTG
ncbi:MAG: hypothetical protein AAF499_09185, partial [Pseudomonadota bacterium]